jgi:hypothetical protein
MLLPMLAFFWGAHAEDIAAETRANLADLVERSLSNSQRLAHSSASDTLHLSA